MDEAWTPWFRLLVERANDLIYLHDMEGKLLYANRKMETATGWRRGEIIGQSILMLLAPEYRAAAIARRDRQPTDLVGHRYELEILCRDGSRLPLEVHSTPVTEHGRVVAWQGIARDIRERRRAQARIAAVYETARQVVGILNLDAVLSLIVERAAEISEAQSCSLWLVDGKQDRLICTAERNAPEGARSQQVGAAADHPVARALRGRTAVIADLGAASLETDAALPPGAVTVACIPLEGSGDALGVLSLSFTSRFAPEPDELALLSTFASHAAAAIANARLFEAQQRKTQETVAIGQIGMTSGALDIEAVLHVTGAYAYDLFAADLTAVLLLEKEQFALRPVFIARRSTEVAPEEYQERLLPKEHPALREAIRWERTVLIHDVASDPLTQGDSRAQELGQSSGMLVPLVTRDGAIGILMVAHMVPTNLTEVQVRLAETLAQQAAVVAENAAMFKAIAAAKQEWEATFDAITDPVCIISRDGRVLRANRAAGALVGMDPSGILGHHSRDIVCWRGAQDGGSIFDECMRTARPVAREVEGLAPPGVFLVTAYPLLGSGGECAGVVECVKDITAQREMQARLYHSARLAGVGELATGVVHNFRNVLMGVSGMLDVAGMLLELGGDVEEVRQRLTSAQEHVFRGNQVLERLLSLAQRRPLEVTDVRLDILLQDVVMLCKAHPACRGVQLTTDLPANLPVVRADAGELHEVLMNLVLNAMQATCGQGVVTISAVSSSTHLRLSVTDNGCGISAEELERIFEPFYSRRQQGSPGTGIGLSASLRMVQAMSGDISVASRVGEGSTFTVTLPVSPDVSST